MIVLGVAVDQKACICEMFRIQTARPRHPLLLIDGDDGTQCTVFFRVLHNCEDLRNTDAVVAAETRAVRRQIFLRAYKLDRIFQGIIGDACLRDTDHIHMPLQNCERSGLTALRCRHIGDDVEDFVLRHRTADLRKALLEIVTDRTLMSRGARNVRQCLELRNDRLQNFCIIDHTVSS